MKSRQTRMSSTDCALRVSNQSRKIFAANAKPALSSAKTTTPSNTMCLCQDCWCCLAISISTVAHLPPKARSCMLKLKGLYSKAFARQSIGANCQRVTISNKQTDTTLQNEFYSVCHMCNSACLSHVISAVTEQYWTRHRTT